MYKENSKNCRNLTWKRRMILFGMILCVYKVFVEVYVHCQCNHFHIISYMYQPSISFSTSWYDFCFTLLDRENDLVLDWRPHLVMSLHIVFPVWLFIQWGNFFTNLDLESFFLLLIEMDCFLFSKLLDVSLFVEIGQSVGWSCYTSTIKLYHW